VYGYRPQFRGFIIRALDTWCVDSGKKLSYKLVDDPKLADVKVKFTRDELPMQESNRVRQKAGLTWLESNGDGKGLMGRVEIRTVCAFDPSKLVQDGQCASVCMHEIGHAMGLGHSTCFNDIMYFGSSSKQTGMPSVRDKATIKRLYEDYPVVAFAPQKTTTDDTTNNLQYLPPPMFVPPKPVDTDKLAPPMFLPPPIKSESQKLQPPLFVPPPVNTGKASHADRQAAPPSFMPPPLPKSDKKNKKLAPPTFLPPPLKN
jgi:hypothetical protein